MWRYLKEYWYLNTTLRNLIIEDLKDREEKWDLRFLSLAKFISEWSKDLSTKVGAVITDQDNRVVSLGYNGYSKGVPDIDLYNREEKLKKIVHAEMNSILFSKRDLTGCTLFTFPFLPCSNCSAMIIQTGISRVVSYKNTIERWEESINLSKELFKETNIEVVEY